MHVRIRAIVEFLELICNHTDKNGQTIDTKQKSRMSFPILPSDFGIREILLLNYLMVI